MREKDPLFIAMTRPPMIMGVTFLFMGINVIGVAFVFVLTKNLLHLLFGIPIHLIGYLICMRDPQLIDVYVKKSQKTSGVTNRKYWSGSSYER